jgi:MFS family permease
METGTDSAGSLSKSHDDLPRHSPEVQEKNVEAGLQQQEQPEAPPRDMPAWKWTIVIAAIYSSQFLFALDNTIVANVQPAIVEEFNAVQKLTWLSVAFLISAASTNLVWGKVYGQFNAKWTYTLSVLVFEVGSAVCGAAPNVNAFIIGRAICGVSGAGMYVGLMTMIAVTTTLKERPVFVGGTGLVWGLGTVLGPIIGGAFTDSSAGWRWAFYINLVIGGLCAPVYVFMLPSKDPRPGVSTMDRCREFDYVGVILMIGACACFVMGVSFGGVTYAWNSGQIIGLFCTSGILFIILGFQQDFTVFTNVVRRVCPVEFFGSRTVLILFAMTAAGGTALFLPIYMAPLYFQFTRSDSALQSGVRLLPFIFLVIFTITSNGVLLSRWGLYMPWYLIGGILVAVGGGLMYTVTLTTSVSSVYGYTVILGFGVGMFAQASYSVAQAVVQPELVPSAIGFISTAQIFGITLALAIANALFLNESEKGIHALLPEIPSEEIAQTIAGAQSTLLHDLSPDVKTQVLEVIVNAQSKTYILVIVAGALVTLLSLLMKRERLFIAAGAAGGA